MTILFEDDFETGDFSNWDSGTGTINNAAAMEGSNGWEIISTEFNDASVIVAGGTVDGISHFAFRLDINNFVTTAGTANPIDFIDLLATADALLDIDLIDDGGIDLRFIHEDDDTTAHAITFNNLSSGAATWEAKITRASNDTASDGEFEVFRNSSSIGSITGIDNFDTYNNIGSTQILVSAIGGEGDSGSLYLDDITLRDDNTTIFPGSNAMRFLGMDNDSDTVYLTGLKDGVFTLYTYTLDGSFTESGTIQDFGSSNDTDLDNRATDLKPYVIADDVLYLYGRDGNDAQIQYTTGGTGAWVDVGAGTATWAAAKIIVGMGANLFDKNDVIVGFRDDDIYQTLAATFNWTKNGDLSASVNHLNRHPYLPTVLLAGGTAAGTTLYSHNRGVSDLDISFSSFAETDDFAIIEGGDDGQAGFGTWNNSSSTGKAGNDTFSGTLDIGYRFQNSPIPGSVTITNAYLLLKANNGTTGTPNLIIYAEDADNAAQITNLADYNGRVRTSASVTWDPTGIALNGTAQSPDITAPIQEVIDRNGYTINNSIQVFLENNGSTVNNLINLSMYEASPSPTKAGTLHIEYTTSAGVMENVDWSF